MARFDPLHSAAAACTAKQWDEGSWRKFGSDTGTSDILINHPRLYRSLSFGDDDYPDAAMDVLGRLLHEAPEGGSGEKDVWSYSPTQCRIFQLGSRPTPLLAPDVSSMSASWPAISRRFPSNGS